MSIKPIHIMSLCQGFFVHQRKIKDVNKGQNIFEFLFLQKKKMI